MSLVVRRVGPEAAVAMLSVVRAAFAARPPLDPPTDALGDTVESLELALSGAGGLMAEADGTPVGSLVLDRVDGCTFLRRFGVVPQAQGGGVARALVVAACDAVETSEVCVLARPELPETVSFWRARGFVEVTRRPPYVELRRQVSATYDVPEAGAMRALGEDLARRLQPGDLVVLAGELGSGKTTLTQGIGAGLGVRGAVTSPTFVIARVHPPLALGPALVHVDAYRLGGLAELDDLDLDTAFDEAVTVVEWGSGLAEGLSESRLEVRLERAAGGDAGGQALGGPDPRRAVVRGYGPRWVS